MMNYIEEITLAENSTIQMALSTFLGMVRRFCSSITLSRKAAMQFRKNRLVYGFSRMVFISRISFSRVLRSVSRWAPSVPAI
jgi:hypothetical protein